MRIEVNEVIRIFFFTEEEKPAAMHGGDRPNSSSRLEMNVLLFLMLVLIGANSMRGCCTGVPAGCFSSSSALSTRVVSSSNSHSSNSRSRNGSTTWLINQSNNPILISFSPRTDVTRIISSAQPQQQRQQQY